MIEIFDMRAMILLRSKHERDAMTHEEMDKNADARQPQMTRAGAREGGRAGRETFEGTRYG